MRYVKNQPLTQALVLSLSPSAEIRIATGIEYDGSMFNGWQKQSSPMLDTVQSELERALSQIANTQITTICAGRTDAGVHATCQVAHFDSPIDRPEKAWTRGVNSLLPSSVRVLWARNVNQQFHARFSATARRYQYVFYQRKTASAIMKSRATHVVKPLDVNAMNRAAQYLLGEQDFSVFRAAGCQAKSPFRRITMAAVSKRNGFIVFDIQANAFLQHMVRNIAGVLLEIGQGGRDPDWINELIACRDRPQGGLTAAPDGLYLTGVAYPSDFSLPQCYEIPVFLQIAG